MGHAAEAVTGWALSIALIFAALYLLVGLLLLAEVCLADRKWPKLKDVGLVMFCWPMAFLDNRPKW